MTASANRSPDPRRPRRPRHARAQTVYTKAGFVREGVLRHSFYQDGR